MGGVINIITVKKQKPGLQLGASVSNTSAMPGSYRDRSGAVQGPHWADLLDTQNISLSAAYGKNDFSVSGGIFANRADNHFLFKDYLDYIRRKDNNEVWDTGAQTSLVWELPEAAKIISSANMYYGDKNIPVSGFSQIVGKQRDISASGNFSLDMPRAFNDNLSTEASVAWHFAGMDYTSASDDSSRHNQQNAILINRWGWYPAERLTLRSGIDYNFSYLNSTGTGIHTRHDGGVYLTAEYRPVKQFMVIPSVKAAVSGSTSAKIIVIPKLGLVWDVTDFLTLKNNYFRSFKFPDFEELYWSGSGVGNPDLSPEDGWGADIGAVSHYKSIKLENVFFTQWLKDSIHWYPGENGIWRPENVGEAVFFGLDNRLEFEIPVSWGPVTKIIPSISYQYLSSYLLSFGYSFSSGKRIPYSPEHTAGVSLEFPWKTGSAVISGHFESRRFNDRANLTVLKPYFLLNATINKKLGNNINTFCAIRNILNTSYESFEDYPMPGLTVTLGLKMMFEANQETK